MPSLNDNMNDSRKDESETGEAGTGGSGSGSQSGEIVFHYQDPYSIAPRDDQLPLEEMNQLLALHNHLHQDYVEKQRLTRKERAVLKEGKIHYTPEGQRKGLGGGGGQASQFKQHPISLKAQFSGIDKQVHQFPTRQEAQTNDALQQELRLQLQLQQRPENAPRFVPPKLRPSS